MIRSIIFFLALQTFSCVSVHATETPDPANAMAKAANAFLAALPPAKREKASIAFHSEERLNWHFVPKLRQGLPLKQLTPDERLAALALLKSSLSANGLRKVDAIRNLEEVLRAIEGNANRDAEQYYFTVFGEPAEKGTWGWRYEGHHASFNWTIIDGMVVASSPQFLGANPADVGDGPRKGTRALAAEEDLGRALLKSLSAEQSQLAILSSTAPLGFFTVNARDAMMQEDKGVAYTLLTAEQQGLLLALIQEHASAQPAAVAQSRLARVKADIQNVKFAWMGGREKGQSHYYRIQGATFLIEYDNIQNNANHIHCVWREFKGDWGKDVLAAHYRTASHHAKHRVGDKDAKKAAPLK